MDRASLPLPAHRSELERPDHRFLRRVDNPRVMSNFGRISSRIAEKGRRGTRRVALARRLVARSKSKIVGRFFASRADNSGVDRESELARKGPGTSCRSFAEKSGEDKSRAPKSSFLLCAGCRGGQPGPQTTTQEHSDALQNSRAVIH